MCARPDEDEFLICAKDGGVRLSTVLTNEYCDFFGLDEETLANKYESGRSHWNNSRLARSRKGSFRQGHDNA